MQCSAPLLSPVWRPASSTHLHVTSEQHACARAPVNLPKLGGEGLLFRVPVMVQALLAYMTAEALLNAPRLLGSLEVLFNPVGLMTSVSIGFQDMLALPLAAIEARSASQVRKRSASAVFWNAQGPVRNISAFETILDLQI